MKHWLYILVFLNLFFTRLYSQEGSFLQFSTDRGLASSEVYCLAQDNNGYMWFGTSRGISRFDGIDFETFSASDGLPSNSVIEMIKDRFGRIWFANFDGSLSYYDNGKFVIPDFNKELKKIDKNYFIRQIYVDEDSVIWIAPARGGIYKIFHDGKIVEYKPEITETVFFIKDFGDDVIGAYYRSSSNSDSLKVLNKGDEYFISGIKQGFRKQIVKIRHGEYLFSVGNSVYHLRNNNIIEHKNFESEVSNIFVDDKKQFWISLMYNGVHVFGLASLEYPQTVFLKGITPSKVFQDKQGGYWVTTTSKSIFYAPDFQFNYVDNKQIGNIQALTVYKNFLYVSTYKKIIYELKRENRDFNIIDSVSLANFNTYPAQDIAVTADGVRWFLQNNLLIKNDKTTEVVAKLSQAYRIFNIDTFLVVAAADGVHLFSRNTQRLKKYEDIPVANCVYADDTNKIWIGTINGLYLYENDKIKYFGDRNNLLKSRINDIVRIGDKLLLATNGSGILIYYPLKDTLININVSNKKLASNFVNSLSVENQIIWAGTNNGLSKVNIVETSDSLIVYVDNFSVGDGLYAKEIKDIAHLGNVFYLATNQGLIFFDEKKIKKNSSTPFLLLDSVYINDSKVPTDTVYRIKTGKNTVTVFYKGICFYAGNQLVYQYKLQGYDDKWIKTKDRLLRFAQLPAGNYTLYVRASADGENWSANMIELHFSVRKKFVQTFGFYLILLFSVFVLAFLFMSYQFSNMQRELRLNRKMLHSEQKALRAQMNPHFIFNALNSIRRYILVEDMENADNYLTNFAMLMRKVLENSKHEFISLNEEIETLRIYMELERLRFDESFSFDIEIDQELNLSRFSVPPMIIQPAVENAIWHGLAPLGKNGRLSLSFKKVSENSFVCIVADNGIGREKALEISRKRKKHKSTGLKNLQERIALINEIGIMNINYKTIDLYDTNGKPTGTRVEITFTFVNRPKKRNNFIKFLGRNIYYRIKKKK